MEVEFDPAKDRLNIAKHGVSLARAGELEDVIVVPDARFSGERRFRLYGRLDGAPYCLAAVFRNGVLRAISFRRAHTKEYLRHVSE